MGTERDKMLAGELYNPNDAELVDARRRARLLYSRLTQTSEDEHYQILSELLGSFGPGLTITAPFYCDYGTNIRLGTNVYFNVNCVVLDVAPVTIGSYCLFGPGVQLYTAAHPLEHTVRRRLEFAKPITIGDDVWIGGGVIVCPGVTIGSRSVIGAGSVVTKDIPEDSLAFGNPCTVRRRLPVEAG